MPGPPSDATAVLGVDGCPGGWVGVRWEAGPGSPATVLVENTFDDLVAAASAASAGGPPACVGVDMPIGLPDAGVRESDRLARLRLPPGRKSSVFPTPTRVACESASWAEANAANRAAAGRGLSQQGYGLARKILELDAWLREGAGRGVEVLEIHPEVSFASIDPLVVVPSKKTAAGREARAAALGSVGLHVEPVRRPGCAVDDLLDAAAVAWTAWRWTQGLAERLPDPPEVFSDGLPAAIWA